MPGRVPVRRPAGGRRRCSRSGPRGRRDRSRGCRVDENDNDPIVLLTYVAAALDRITPLDASVFEALASPGVSVEATADPAPGRRLWRRWTSRTSWYWTTCTCSTTRRAWTRSSRSRGMCPRARSWRCPRRPAPCSRWERCGRGAWPGDRAGRASLGRGGSAQLLRARRRSTSRMPRSPSSRSTRRAGPRVCTWLRSQPRRAAPAQSGATGFRDDDRFRGRLLRSELLAQLPRDELRFLTRTASSSACGSALRRGARDERLGGRAGGARALQPVRGCAGRNRAVVSLPPPLPGAAAFGARARRAGARAASARSCVALVRGERAAGDAIRYAQAAGDVDRAARLVVRWALPDVPERRAATSKRWLEWLAGDWGYGAGRGGRCDRRR